MELPDGCDGASLARAALEENVVLAPGDVFSVAGAASSFLRFNVAQSADPKLVDALRRALMSKRRADRPDR